MAKLILTLEDCPDGSVDLGWEPDQMLPAADAITKAYDIATFINAQLNQACEFASDSDLGRGLFDTSAMSESAPETDLTEAQS